MKENKLGMSLVEVVISTAVFAIVAAGITSTTMLTSRIAHENIYESTAYLVAQAYAEQIKSIRFSRIQQALNDPGNFNIPAESITIGKNPQSGGIRKEDPLTFGEAVEKEIIVDIEKDSAGEERLRTMTMWITTEGEDLGASLGPWDSIEITLNFDWEVAGAVGVRRQSGVVKLVKTNVAEF